MRPTETDYYEPRRRLSTYTQVICPSIHSPFGKVAAEYNARWQPLEGLLLVPLSDGGYPHTTEDRHDEVQVGSIEGGKERMGTSYTRTTQQILLVILHHPASLPDSDLQPYTKRWQGEKGGGSLGWQCGGTLH